MLSINTSFWRPIRTGSWLLLSALPSLMHAASLPISDNLPAPTAYTENAQGQTWLGAPFRTNSAATLTSVSLLLANPSAGDALLSLYAGTGQPDTFVGSLMPPAAYSMQLSTTTFTGNGLTLNPASGYWVVLRPLSGRFEWAFTESSVGAGAGFTPGWGVTDNGGASWFTAQSEPMQMRVEAEAVPEPSSFALVTIGACALGVRCLVRRRAAARTAAGSLLLTTGMIAAPAPAVSIVKPGTGEAVRTLMAPIELQLDPTVNAATLQAWLNGKNVSAAFIRSGHCRPSGCPYTANVAAVDGLRQGRNTLWVRATTRSGQNGSWHTRFDWLPGGLPGQLPGDSSSLPPAVGFRTIGPGGGSASGGNWIQVYSNQGAGTSTTYPKGTACTTSYQVLALDRQTLAPKQDGGYTDGYKCFDDDALLTAALKSFTSADLVVVSNSWGQGIWPKLDTTPIGGTNYAGKADYPVGYMIVGVGGAAAGQAYENITPLSLQSDPDIWPRANGLLAVDKDGNYTFHPSDYVEFKVRPVDSKHSSSPSITVGKDTYTPPAGTNGFWLLLLDRRTLFSNPGCTASSTEANTWINCGTFYATGDSNSTTAIQASVNLSNALKGANWGQLLFLVGTGTPAGYTGFPSTQLADAVNSLGGSGYTLGRMNVATAYTLVSSNDSGFEKPFTGSAVLSTNLGEGGGPSGINNGQTGFVKGVLGRDHNGLLRPLAASQETKDTIDTAQEADFSAYSIFWSQPGAWPFMDTPGRVAAYKWLSYQIVNAALVNPSGNHRDDLRYYYPGSTSGDLVKIDPTTNSGTAQLPPDVLANGWVDPVDNAKYTITEADRATVASQLKAELNALSVAINYFDGASTGGGIRAALLDNGSSFAAGMFNAMANVQNSLAAAPSTDVSVELSKVLKLTGTLVSLGRTINPALGVMGALLNLASTVTAPKTAPNQIPSAFAAYETTLAGFATWSDDYRKSLSNGLDTVIDNTYSDWAKLQAVSRNASNTESAWYYRNQTDLEPLNEPAAKGAERHFYLQLLPKSYSVDFWAAQPVNTPQQIGTKYTECVTTDGGTVCNTFCGKVYSKYAFPGWSWMNYATPDQHTKTDLFVIGGSLNRNNSTSVTETFPSADLLRTLFDPQGELRFPRDLFYSPNGPLSRRSGPMYTNQMCY